MGRADYWLPGGWNMVCQVCGFKYKNTEMKLRWDNVWCCPEDWELRQPQDFVRGVKDQMAVPYSNPEPPNVFSGTLPTPTGEIVVGTPALYVNGVLTAAYTIVLPQGQVTFTTPPPLNAAIQWTGVWLHNSGAQQKFTTPFQFAQGDGSTTVFNIYWAYVPY
jgi:hypothetical protein